MVVGGPVADVRKRRLVLLPQDASHAARVAVAAVRCHCCCCCGLHGLNCEFRQAAAPAVRVPVLAGAPVLLVGVARGAQEGDRAHLAVGGLLVQRFRRPRGGRHVPRHRQGRHALHTGDAAARPAQPGLLRGGRAGALRRVALRRAGPQDAGAVAAAVVQEAVEAGGAAAGPQQTDSCHGGTGGLVLRLLGELVTRVGLAARLPGMDVPRPAAF